MEQQFDVILNDAPEDMCWCTRCQQFEKWGHPGSIVTDISPELAPITYSFWLTLIERYGDYDSYRKWLRDGKPAI